jgi:hypothetical protein
MEEFINKWQTLIGSTLGPFLAIILSAIGFYIKSIIENKNKHKEFLRRIEISTTRSLNDIYTVREQLKQFAALIKSLAEEARAETDDSTYFLNRINFPTIREIYRDIEISTFGIRSYYLHNKLLWIDAGIKEVNETLFNLKNDFEGLIRQNEILVVLTRDNPNPPTQRKTYANNLESFSKAIEDYTSTNIQKGIELMTQIKIYNELMRGKHGYWFWWKQEGTKFKYFRTKSEQKEFSRNLDSLDRIDKVIKQEVDLSIENAEKRFEKLSQDRTK